MLNLLFILLCIIAAFYFQKHPVLKNFSYATFVIAAVITALSFPQYFISIGTFKLTALIVPLLQLIMFGMGSQLSLKDFTSVIKQPRAVAIGLVCQFSIMPVIALTLINIFQFPAEIAAGIILVGCSPSGLASNVMSYLARANIALSITLTAIASLLAPIMTPFLMKTLIGQLIPVDLWSMMLGIFNIVILPIAAGILFNAVAYENAKIKKAASLIFMCLAIILVKDVIVAMSLGHDWPQIWPPLLQDILWFVVLPYLFAISVNNWFQMKREDLDNTLTFISMFGIGLIILVITAAGRDSLMQIGLLLILACLVHNFMGYTMGYWIGRLFRLDEKSCKTIALEVGMQNAGLASGIAVQMGKVATVGLASSVFGPLMNVTGSSLALWWRGRSEETEE